MADIPKKTLWIAMPKPKVVLGSGEPDASVSRHLERFHRFGTINGFAITWRVTAVVATAYVAFSLSRMAFSTGNKRSAHDQAVNNNAALERMFPLAKHKIGAPVSLPEQSNKYKGHDQ